MDWSISKAKLFQSCQRKWYFASIARWNAKKEPVKREAFILKNLQTIQGWRGSLVDSIIEKKILLPIMFGNPAPSENIVISYALSLADKQLDFAIKKKYREPGVSKAKVGDIFAALFEVEYNSEISNEQIEYAKEEIQIAIREIYRSQIFKEISTAETKLLIQRDLKYLYNGFYVNAKPDLVILRDNQPPHIVDWKVHDNRFTDYWQQLTVYAYVLFRVAQLKPHGDFPAYFISNTPPPHTYSITEYQLLKGVSKTYTISEDDIENVQDLIHITGEWMQEFHAELDNLSAQDFSTTTYPGLCISCSFKKICQEVENHDAQRYELF